MALPGEIVELINVGVWANEPDSYLYQWYLDGAIIPDETGTFIEVPDSVHSELQLGVRGINDNGEGDEVLSAPIIISSPFIPEAQQLFDRMDVKPPTNIREQIAYCIEQLIDYDLWDISDILYVDSGTQQGTLQNWKGDRFNGTVSGIVDYVPYRGFKGNGLDFYIDTHFDPSIQMPLGSKFQKDSLSFGSAVQDTNGTASATRFLMGIYAGTSYAAIDHSNNASTANLTSFKIGSSANFVSTSAVAPHHWMGVRSSSTSVRLYKDASQHFSNNAANSQNWFPNGGSILLHARRRPDTGGNIQSFNIIRQSMYHLGGAMTAQQASDFFYIMNEYLAYIGAEERQYRPISNVVVSISPLNPVQNTEITYRISLQEGTNIGSIDYEITGDLLDSNFNKSFNQALQESVAVTAGVSLVGNRITFSSNFAGVLEVKRTLTSVVSNDLKHNIVLSNPDNVKIFVPIATVVTGTPSKVLHGKLFGWNNSGFEFKPLQLPPSIWTYGFASAKGFNAFRIPYLIQAIQPMVNGPINNAYATQYKAHVDLAISQGCYVILDPHNYGGRSIDGVNYTIGSDQYPVSSFLDHIEKMNAFIGNHPNIIWNIMNEPLGMAQSTWWKVAQATVNKLRSVGFKGDIQVPGTNSTGASTWVSSGNAAFAMQTTDPLNNLTFEVHQYFDDNNSGSTGVCITNSQNRLQAVINWAETNNKKIFMGEIAAGNPSISGQEQCANVLPSALTMWNNSTATNGLVGWGYGDRWGSTYHFRALQMNINTQPDTWYMDIMEDYIDEFLGS